MAVLTNPMELALMRRIDRQHLEYSFMGARLLRETLYRERNAQRGGS